MLEITHTESHRHHIEHPGCKLHMFAIPGLQLNGISKMQIADLFLSDLHHIFRDIYSRHLLHPARCAAIEKSPVPQATSNKHPFSCSPMQLIAFRLHPLSIFIDNR